MPDTDMHDAPNRTAMRGAQFAWGRHDRLDLSTDDPSVYAIVQQRAPPATRLWMPAFVGIAAALACTTLGLDLLLADALYAWQQNQWALRWTFTTEQVLHVAGRNASAGAWFVVVGAGAATWLFPRWHGWRRPLACLAVSVLLSTALVAWIKTWSNLDCPWDLLRYGGERAYVGLFAIRPAGMPHGACFPAGHASGGYAWMAVYFLFVAVRPSWRWYGLAAGVVLGLTFGVSQQLRGAHFLSHDLWTAALCWLVAVAVHAVARQPLRPDRMTGHAAPGDATSADSP